MMEIERIEQLLATRHPRERTYEGALPAVALGPVLRGRASRSRGLRPRVGLRGVPMFGRRRLLLGPIVVVVVAIAAFGVPMVLAPVPAPTSAAPVASATETATGAASPTASARPTPTATATIRVGAFSRGPSMTTYRLGSTATLLEDGRVLFAGGFRPGEMIRPAEVFDPVGERFVAVGNLVTVRYDAAAALLADGRVLLVGGFDKTGTPLADAELFDPATNSFTRTGSLHVARGLAAAVSLPTGKVLVLSGSTGDPQAIPVASAELYDPASGRFEMTGPLAEARQDACVVGLADGDVLVAGGHGKDAFASLASGGSAKGLSSAELYHPADGRFHSVGSMASGRAGGVCTLLADGRVLVAGGEGEEGPLHASELYVPASQGFVAADDVTAWAGQQAVRLADGRVLVTFTGQLTEMTQLYVPTSGRFITGPDMIEQRSGASMTPLRDGRVLLAGGMVLGDSSSPTGTQLYTP